MAEQQRQTPGAKIPGRTKAGLEKAGLEDVGERVLDMQSAIEELIQTITNLKYDVDTAEKKARALQKTLRTTQSRVQTHLDRVKRSKT